MNFLIAASKAYKRRPWLHLKIHDDDAQTNRYSNSCHGNSPNFGLSSPQVEYLATEGQSEKHEPTDAGLAGFELMKP